MASIKFDGVNVEEKSVTVLVNDAPLTRPLPESSLSSAEALEDYMRVYVAGLKVEFPDEPQKISAEEVTFTKGQEL